MSFNEITKVAVDALYAMRNDSSSWLINMYLKDPEEARKDIKHKLDDLESRKRSYVGLEEIKYICRALKETDKYPGYVTNYDSFIPKYGTLNRWNPKDKIFLYLACSLCEENIFHSEEWNICELTCINEIRTESNVKISLAKFMINNEFNNAKVLNLDVEEDYLNKNFDEGGDKISETIEEYKKNVKDMREIIHAIENIKNRCFPEILSETIREVRTNYFLDTIFTPLDENSNPQIEYSLFHILAEEAEKLGYVGILYPSTRMSLIGKKGTNLVLFDANKYCFPNKEVEIKHGIYRA